MNKKIIFSLLIITLGVLLLLKPDYAVAGVIVFDDPLMKNQTLDGIVDALVDLIFKIGVVVAPLLIIFGAFLIVTAGGSAEQVVRGRKVILWTDVGCALVLLARGLVDLIGGLLGL